MRDTMMTKHIASRRLESGGFTLVELMIVVVIVAILASIAIPAYNAQIRKSRRTEAKTALLDLAGREERYFNANTGTNAYTDVPALLGYAATMPQMQNYPVGSGYYTVTVTFAAADPTATPPSPARFTIVATPVGDQAQDLQCQTFTVTSTGAQTAFSNTDPNASTDCWK
jgi:type IV pilus assembly protein PilE